MKHGLRGILVLGAALALSGCSSVPQWANPSAMVDRIFGEEDATPARNQFPQVANVPREAPATTTPAQRDAAVAGLTADRANAQYTNEQLRQGGQVADTALTPAPAPTTPTAAPAPGPRVAQLAPTVPIGTPAVQTVRPITPAQAPTPGPAVPDLAVPVPPVFQGGPQVTLGGGPQPVPPPPVNVTPLQPTAPVAAQAVPPPAVNAAPAPRPTTPAPAPAAVAAAPAPAPTPTAAPAPAPVTAAPTPVPAPAPIAQAAPVATPAPAPTAQPRAAAPLTQAQVQTVLPAQNAGGQDTLARTFAQMLAQSQGTVTVQSPLGGPPPVLTPVAPIQAIPAPAGANQALPNVVVGGAVRPNVATNVPVTGGGAQQFNLAGAARPTAMVMFAHDSTRLSPDAMRNIRAIADQYKARGGKVHIVGHASQRTKDMAVDKHVMANFKVSIDRAQAVLNEFLRLGVPPAALIVDAVGDTQPRFLEAMPAGEAGNRRVEIILEA